MMLINKIFVGLGYRNKTRQNLRIQYSKKTGVVVALGIIKPKAGVL